MSNRLQPMISVVIPSYNRCGGILALLRDVHAQEGAGFEVIVVDDGSTDGTVEEVRRNFPQVKLLVNEANRGPCVTRNRGIREAKGEFIIGLDSDVTLPDTRLFAKVAAIFRDHPEATGLAFRILKPDGVTEDVPRWWHPQPVATSADKAFATSYFSGTGYAFRRDEMIRAGLYPEVFYMHYEEVELALRILDQGGSIRYSPELVVLHHANEVSRRGEIQVYYKPRNQVLLTVSAYPLWRGIGYLVPRLAYQFSVAAREGHLADFRRAMKDAFLKSREILLSRKPLKAATMKKISRLRGEIIS